MTGETSDVRFYKRKPGWTLFEHQPASISINQHQPVSASISINQHWSASISINQHQPASTSISISINQPQPASSRDFYLTHSEPCYHATLSSFHFVILSACPLFSLYTLKLVSLFYISEHWEECMTELDMIEMEQLRICFSFRDQFSDGICRHMLWNWCIGLSENCKKGCIVT